MAGRKPKPANLRILQGNPGKRAIKNSVQLPIDVIAAPEFLTGYAFEEWLRLEPILRGIGVVTVADRGALVAYCSAWGDLLNLEAAIFELPLKDRYCTVSVADGRTMRQPLARARDEARRDMIRFAAELGITPSARNKVTAVVKPDKPNKFKGLNGGKK